MQKRFVCLANSRKLQGRCIAGRELIADRPGSWVRPVSAREHEEVSEYERQYADGADPRVLDIIEVSLLKHTPGTYQSENWLIDPEQYWNRVGQLPKYRLSEFTDPVGSLWINGHSSYNGTNDRIPQDQAAALTDSLRLVKAEAIQLAVFAPGEAFGNSKRRVQGRFSFAGTAYALWVTDPNFERRYLSKPDGEYALDSAFLTVSLGEPYDGFVYKMVAGIVV